jgi:hypothetical protein
LEHICKIDIAPKNYVGLKDKKWTNKTILDHLNDKLKGQAMSLIKELDMTLESLFWGL